MNLSSKRRIAAQLLKCGKQRVRFDSTKLDQVKESITKSDVRGLINDGVVTKAPQTGISRARARHNLKQKRKGRRAGQGRKRGTHNARIKSKTEWMNKIRAIRDLLKHLRDKKVIETNTYRTLYRKSKGGFFRSRRHIKLYIEEHKLSKQNEKPKTKGTSVQKKA